MAATLTPWQRLTATATLGTARAPLPTDLWPDATAAFTAESVEATLLRAAAATYIWQQAGNRSAPDANVEQAPQHTPRFTAAASEAAAWRLGKMIQGEHKELIPEWFTLARAAGRIVPPHWLPVALDALPVSLRNEFSAVFGPAAQWLASLNPAWALRDATQAPSEERWNTGTIEERAAELRAMRQLDPAQARAWMQGTWANDPPEAREAFLHILLIGLSPDDESFLDTALDDKRKAVRMAAFECLSRLPQSAHAQRNLARLEALVILEQKKAGLLSGLRKRKLQIELPAALEKATLRDGIEAKPPAQRKIGERVFWLTQMIAIAPPAHWSERFDCDAATFIEAALATDYASELLGALTSAIARHPEPTWIEALNTAWLAASDGNHALAQTLSTLLVLAPAAERSRLLETQLRELGARRFDVCLQLLQEFAMPWTSAVTEQVFAALRAAVRSDRQQWSHARTSLDAWGQRCDLSVAASAVPALLEACGEQSPWRNALEQLSDIVDFRLAMTRELSP